VHVLIADDHRLVIEGVKLKLAELEADTQFTLAMSVDELFAAIDGGADFDLAVIDLNMPGASGNSHLVKVRSEHPTLPVIVLSGSDDPAVMRSVLDLGVLGFIPKAYSPEVMLSAVRLVMAGGVYIPAMMMQPRVAMSADTISAVSSDGEPSIEALRRLLTDRQVEVLRLLSNGKPNKLIARDLGISEGTVKIHLAAIFRALNVRNRTEAVVASRRLAEMI
jgi:DNA-binding NarL/FixJ family response regulator